MILRKEPAVEIGMWAAFQPRTIVFTANNLWFTGHTSNSLYQTLYLNLPFTRFDLHFSLLMITEVVLGTGHTGNCPGRNFNGGAAAQFFEK